MGNKLPHNQKYSENDSLYSIMTKTTLYSNNSDPNKKKDPKVICNNIRDGEDLLSGYHKQNPIKMI